MKIARSFPPSFVDESVITALACASDDRSRRPDVAAARLPPPSRRRRPPAQVAAHAVLGLEAALRRLRPLPAFRSARALSWSVVPAPPWIAPHGQAHHGHAAALPPQSHHTRAPRGEPGQRQQIAVHHHARQPGAAYHPWLRAGLGCGPAAARHRGRRERVLPLLAVHAHAADAAGHPAVVARPASRLLCGAAAAGAGEPPRARTAHTRARARADPACSCVPRGRTSATSRTCR